MAVQVSRVFEDVSGHAIQGAEITIILTGGSVKTPTGEVISYLTQPRPF